MAEKRKTPTRAIFEEVATETRIEAARPGRIGEGRSGARGAIRIWLLILFALVAAMIIVGGLTRLSDAGLSITEWRPVTGALPPMNDAAWLAEFEKYRASPQYQYMNAGMSLEAFKQIYWWEWGHRLLGRLVGLVWALGFFGFLIARKIPAGWTGRLLLPGVLGGVQGAIGWWMVASGLTGEMTSVASYRLAIHLGLAFVILGFLWWYALLLGRSEADLLQARRAREPKLFSMSTGLMHFAFLQILIGALVAGIDAGRSFTDWPLMDGAFFPPGGFYIEPFWRNFFENPGVVQFMHRMVAYLLFVFGIVVWARGRRSSHAATRAAFNMVLAALLLQVVLGIAAVLTGAQLHAAITHQLGAILLWVMIIRARYLSQYPIQTSIRGTRA
ncbi:MULTISPECIES: heme A synthase [unclassified Haematobacter]|uniref:heme A synthase n=1 Tax=unclassified Haematobacter TaxID=2640585 RepID=UPI0025BB525F|nr:MULTISPECIES: heme A synthase [unclassified Haematobacter]